MEHLVMFADRSCSVAFLTIWVHFFTLPGIIFIICTFDHAQRRTNFTQYKILSADDPRTVHICSTDVTYETWKDSASYCIHQNIAINKHV